MQEFRAVEEMLMWFQVAVSLGILLILIALALVLFIPGIIKEDDHKVEKGMGAVIVAIVAMIATGYLPYRYLDADQKIGSACVAALADLSSGKSVEVTPEEKMTVSSTCSEDFTRHDLRLGDSTHLPLTSFPGLGANLEHVLGRA